MWLDKTENPALELIDESGRSVTLIISIKQLSSTVTQVSTRHKHVGSQTYNYFFYFQ